MFPLSSSPYHLFRVCGVHVVKIDWSLSKENQWVALCPLWKPNDYDFADDSIHMSISISFLAVSRVHLTVKIELGNLGPNLYSTSNFLWDTQYRIQQESTEVYCLISHFLFFLFVQGVKHVQQCEQTWCKLLRDWLAKRTLLESLLLIVTYMEVYMKSFFLSSLFSWCKVK